MKKTLLVAAASLFVIGQAFAQNQPSGQQSNQPSAAQSEQTQKASRTANSSTRSSHLKKVGRHAGMPRGTHRTVHHARSHRPVREANQQPGWNQQQQGWNWNQQQSSDRPSRRSQRTTSQEPQTTGFGFGGWNQGPCRNGRRSDGSWC